MDFKKNGFMIGIIGGLAVAVILFAVLVFPAWTAASDKAASTQRDFGPTLDAIARKDKVPTQQWVAQADNYQKDVNAASIDLYKFFNRSDAALEHWFDDKEQPRGVLMSRATDGIRDMLNELRKAMGKEHVPADGQNKYQAPDMKGFEFQESTMVADEKEAKLEWMRKYNIHVHVKDALLEAKATDFYKVQFSKVTSPLEMSARQDPRPLGNSQGQTIPFVVEASFLWKDVPAFLASLIRYDDAKPGPMFRIAMLNVGRDSNPIYKPQAAVEEEVTQEEWEKVGGEKGWKPVKTTVVEAPVKVTVLVEAYNFEFVPARTGQ